MRASARATLSIVALAVLAGWLASPASAERPDPGGREDVNVRLPLERGFMGVNENLGVHRSPTEKARAARAMGATVVRTPVSWHWLEPRRGVWNETAWESLAESNRELRRQGVRMLAVLGFAPPWAREASFFPAPGQILPPTLCARPHGACLYPPRPEMDEQWRRFVREAARRLPGALFQTWNEPNWPGFWESGADPERWAELHVAAWEEIKAQRPRAPVVACGCGSSGTGQEGALPISTFLRRAHRHRPSLRYDALGFTVFPQRGSGEGRHFGRGTWFAQVMHEVRRTARATTGRRQRLVIAELGLWTDGPRNELTEAQQADGLTRLIRRVATMRDVVGVVIHRLQAGAWEPLEERGMSVLRPEDGSPKPAYCSFARMAGNGRVEGCPRVRPPRARIVRAPPRVVGDRTVGFRFERSPRSARLECSLNGARFSPCAARQRFNGVRPGRHVLRVRAWHRSGAQQPRPRVHRWRVTR